MADAIHRGLEIGNRAAAAIQGGGVREREHARGESGFGTDDACDLLDGHMLIRERLAHAHGDVRKRRQLDLALRHFLRQFADECKGARDIGWRGGFLGG